MAKFNHGLNGPIKGKAGTIIGSSWRGIPYLKGPYTKRTAPAREGEASNRSRFAVAQYWLKPLTKFVREGFRNGGAVVQGFIAAKSYLLRNAIEESATGWEINPALVHVSAGDLPLSPGISVSRTAAGRLSFVWNAGPIQGADPSDQVMMLAYDIDHRHAYHNLHGQFRSTGADVLATDPTPGKSYHIYCAFTAADRSRQSDSVYLGMVTM
ncbi:MAG: hypothetical protein JST39_10230 [Bacteroidetes bacterium]|nr:hypothetical protein [Bacteroidota bacterium]